MARVLGSNSASPLSVDRVEDRASGLEGGRRGSRWNDQLRQLRREKPRAAQYTVLVPRGAKLPRITAFGQQDARGPRGHHRGSAAHGHHSIRPEASQFSRCRLHRRQWAVRLHACHHAGTPITHRFADEIERRALANQRIAAKDHRAMTAEPIQFAMQRRQ